jgi:hypothetical protein
MAEKKKKYRIHNVNFNAGAICQEVSATLDIFRVDFFKNIEYLKAYTGLKNASFQKEMRRHGVSNAQKALGNIMNKRVYGFDFYLVAAASHVFGLPIKLLVNFDIKEKGIDLEKYGLSPNCYRGKKYTKDGVLYTSHQVESNVAAMQRRINKVKQPKREDANDRANSPERIFNFWSEFDKTSS